MEPAKIPCVSAQWTHEAAHEGRPVSDHREGITCGPRGKGPTQASLIVSRLAWHDFWQPVEQCGFINSFSHYQKGPHTFAARAFHGRRASFMSEASVSSSLFSAIRISMQFRDGMDLQLT